MEMARELDLPLVATNDCHYLNKEDAKAHEVLLCIQTGKTMSDPGRMRFSTEEFYVKTPEEMAAAFHYAPEARCQYCRDRRALQPRTRFQAPTISPAYTPAEGRSLEECLVEEARSGLESAPDADPDMSPRLHRGRPGRPTGTGCGSSSTASSRWALPGYFLIVADFINWAKDHGIPVGPGRGSAAGSLVAYCTADHRHRSRCPTTCCSSGS